MASGEIAANVTIKALKNSDTSERFLSQYQTLWKKDFGKDLELLTRFNKQWGKNSEKIVRLITIDKKLAKLTIGVTGGQLNFSKYKTLILLRYIYASFKSLFIKK